LKGKEAPCQLGKRPGGLHESFEQEEAGHINFGVLGGFSSGVCEGHELGTTLYSGNRLGEPTARLTDYPDSASL
jgi:hypothetical protein